MKILTICFGKSRRKDTSVVFRLFPSIDDVGWRSFNKLPNTSILSILTVISKNFRNIFTSWTALIFNSKTGCFLDTWAGFIFDGGWIYFTRLHDLFSCYSNRILNTWHAHLSTIRIYTCIYIYIYMYIYIYIFPRPVWYIWFIFSRVICLKGIKNIQVTFSFYLLSSSFHFWQKAPSVQGFKMGFEFKNFNLNPGIWSYFPGFLWSQNTSYLT